jgi:hypothetical protein
MLSFKWHSNCERYYQYSTKTIPLYVSYLCVVKTFHTFYSSRWMDRFAELNGEVSCHRRLEFRYFKSFPSFKVEESDIKKTVTDVWLSAEFCHIGNRYGLLYCWTWFLWNCYTYTFMWTHVMNFVKENFVLPLFNLWTSVPTTEFSDRYDPSMSSITFVYSSCVVLCSLVTACLLSSEVSLMWRIQNLHI